MMRLLLVTDAFPPNCGGSGWSTFYLARALMAAGHSVQIIQPKEGVPGIRTRAYENVLVREFGYRVSNTPGLRDRQRTRILDTEFAPFLAARARDADVIHAQHLLSIPPSVHAGRMTGVPVVSTVRDYWPVCLYGTLWRGQAICPVCHGAERVRCLAQRYGPLAALAYPALPLVEQELQRRQRALRDSHAVIAVSRYVAGTLRGIVPDGRLFVVPNLVDIDEVQRLAVAGDFSPAAPYLVFVGKLNRQKGADLLPEIMLRSGANLTLRVVGDGELAGKLRGAPHLELCGWQSNAAALGMIARARVFLFPSRWAEPLSRVLLEAQALGVATIALDTGGTRDIIEDGVNGLLAENVDQFAGQLSQLVADKALRYRLSENALQVAQERFGAPVVIQQMEQVYRSVMSDQP